MTADLSKDAQPDRPLQNLISFRLSQVQAKLNAQATKVLKASGGLTLVQWRILVILQFTGETTVGRIANETHFDKALISRTVQTMVTQGLALMRTDENDHRQHLLTMTKAGQQAFERTAPHMIARQNALTSAMTDDQLSTLFEALDLIEDAADQKIDF